MIKQMEQLEPRQNVKFSLSGGDVPESEGPLTSSKPDTKKIYRCSEQEHTQKSSNMRKIPGDVNGTVTKPRQMKSMETVDRDASHVTTFSEPVESHKSVARTRSDVAACSFPITASEVECRARSDLSGVGDTKKTGINLMGHGDAEHYESKTDPKAVDKKHRSVESLFPPKKSQNVESDERTVSGADNAGRRLHQTDSGSSLNANGNLQEAGDDYFTPSECSLDSPILSELDREKLSHRPSDSIAESQKILVSQLVENRRDRRKPKSVQIVSDLLNQLIDEVHKTRITNDSVTVVPRTNGTPAQSDIFQAMHEECMAAYNMMKTYRIRCAELESRLNDMISMGRRMIPLLNTAQYRNHQMNNQAVRTPVTYTNRDVVYQFRGDRSPLGVSEVIAASVVMVEDEATSSRPGNCGDTAATHNAESEFEIWCVVDCDEAKSRESNPSLAATDDASSTGNVADASRIPSKNIEEDTAEKNSIGIQVNLMDTCIDKCETKDTGIQVNVSEERVVKTASRNRTDNRKREMLHSTSNLNLGIKGQFSSDVKGPNANEKDTAPDYSAGDSKMPLSSDANPAFSDNVSTKSQYSVESSSRYSIGVTKESFVRGKKDDAIISRRSNPRRSIASSIRSGITFRNKGTTQDRRQSLANGPIVHRSQPVVPMLDSKNEARSKPAWDSSVSIANNGKGSSFDTRNGKGAIKKNTFRSTSANRRTLVERQQVIKSDRSTGSSSDGRVDDASSTSTNTNRKPPGNRQQEQGKGDRPNDC